MLSQGGHPEKAVTHPPHTQPAHTDPTHPGGSATTGKHIRRAMLYHGCSQANMSANTAAQQCRGRRGHVQAGHGPQAQARQTGLCLQALSTLCPVPTSTPWSQLSPFCLVPFSFTSSCPFLETSVAISSPLGVPCRSDISLCLIPIVALASLPDFSSTQGYL